MFERDSIFLEFRRLLLVPTVVALLTVAGCGGGDPEPVAATDTPPATDASATDVADAIEPAAGDAGSEDVAAAQPDVAMSVDELLSAASSAVAENRLIAPAGNNAFHYYLRVLDQEPRNSAAQVAILELMPLAQGMTEQLIEARSYDEADQAVALLKRAQPSSVVLATLEQRVISYKRADDQRAQAEERARLAEEARAASAAQAAATPPPAPAPAPTPPPAAPTPAPAPPPTQVASTQPVAPAAPPPSQQNSNFELVTRVNPSYPSRALRQQISGWVELEFTITVAGDVRDVSVVDAALRQNFDREAVRALEAWKFKPKIENGQPVATVARQRLEFSLGN